MADAPPPGDRSVDRAWSVLFGAAICMFCGQPAAILFTFGVFAPAITADTGWSRGEIAAAIGPATITAALLAPIVGRWGDRLGGRRMALFGGPLYAIGFILLGLVPQNPGWFTASLALLCALGFAATPVLYAQLATCWFARRRGLSLSLIFSATSLGIAFWPPFAAWLIGDYGWRVAYAALGVTTGTLIFLSAAFLLRDPPFPAPGRDGQAAPGLGLREALGGGTFWAIVAIFVLLSGALTGVSVNLPILLRGQGLSSLNAAFGVSVVGLAMLVGRLSSGVMLDRWFSPWVTAGFTLGPVIGLAMLLSGSSPITSYVAAALLGLGLGSEMDAAAYLVSRAFGVRCFGAIYGAVTLAYGVSSAIGPAAAGVGLSNGMRPGTLFAAALTSLLPGLALLLGLRARHLPFNIEPLAKSLGIPEQRHVQDRHN